MIAAATRYAPFVIYTRDALGSRAQLKGLKVGTTGPGSEPHTEFQLYLKRVGVDPGDVAFVKVGLEAETLTAMLSGAVQVGLFHWPVDEKAQAAGLHVLVDLRELHIPWILTGFDVPRAMLEEHPNRVRRIAEALVAATGCARAHPAFAASVTAKYTKVADPASLERGGAEFRAVVPPDLTPISRGGSEHRRRGDGAPFGPRRDRGGAVLRARGAGGAQGERIHARGGAVYERAVTMPEAHAQKDRDNRDGVFRRQAGRYR